MSRAELVEFLESRKGRSYTSLPENLYPFVDLEILETYPRYLWRLEELMKNLTLLEELLQKKAMPRGIGWNNLHYRDQKLEERMGTPPIYGAIDFSNLEVVALLVKYPEHLKTILETMPEHPRARTNSTDMHTFNVLRLIYCQE